MGEQGGGMQGDWGEVSSGTSVARGGAASSSTSRTRGSPGPGAGDCSEIASAKSTAGGASVGGAAKTDEVTRSLMGWSRSRFVHNTMAASIVSTRCAGAASVTTQYNCTNRLGVPRNLRRPGRDTASRQGKSAPNRLVNPHGDCFEGNIASDSLGGDRRALWVASADKSGDSAEVTFGNPAGVFHPQRGFNA